MEDIKVNKKLLQTVIGLILAICLLKAIHDYDVRSSPIELKKSLLNVEINNSIRAKYIAKDRRATAWIVLDDGREYRMHNYDVFTKIQLNDLLIKHKNSTKYLLIHNGDSIYFYPLICDDTVK